MATHWQDNVGHSTATTSTTSPMVLSASALSGYKLMASGADGKTVHYSIKDGTDWETGYGTYTHSTRELTRNVVDSSNGGALLSLSGSASVYLDWTSRPAAQSNLSHATGSDADTTMAVNQMYVVDMSAWATADRNYTLPAAAAVGDRIGVMITSGNASFELILKANTGDTLNGVTAAEWSRLFISNEIVIMRCVTADSAWIVERDGRIPCYSVAELTTAVDATNAALTWLAPTDDGGAWTDLMDVGGCMGSTATFTVRRPGKYRLYVKGVSPTSGVQFDVGVSINGNAPSSGTGGTFFVGTKTASSTSQGTPCGARVVSLAAGDTAQWQWRHSSANSGLTAVGWNNFEVAEVLVR